MRSADVIEKVTARHPELLLPHKYQLLGPLCCIKQPDVRWHIAPMLARLPLNEEEKDAVVKVLLGFTYDTSSIVRTAAMQALGDIAVHSPQHLPEVMGVIENLTLTGTPAMKARGRKLIAALTKMPQCKQP